jgi:hypothetical protein
MENLNQKMDVNQTTTETELVYVDRSLEEMQAELKSELGVIAVTLNEFKKSQKITHDIFRLEVSL